MKKVLVTAVHPDDETLGCGGTLLKHKDRGDEIYWMIMTNISTEYGFSENDVKARQEEIKRVTDEYGFNGVFELDLPAAGLDEVNRREIITKVSNVIQQVKPDTVVLPYEFDVHSDHRITFDAVYSCTKTFRYPSIKNLYMMEVVSETEFASPSKGFRPNYFVDITNHMEDKLNLFDIYKSESGDHPFPRSRKNIQAIATFRGAMSGCRYAESFMVLKEIW